MMRKRSKTRKKTSVPEKKRRRAKPVSLYPMEFDEAMKILTGTRKPETGNSRRRAEPLGQEKA